MPQMNNDMKKTAFVTGSNGFVGLNLCEELLQQNWRVLALHRKHSDISFLQRMPVELLEGDILDKESLMCVLPDKADAVFHVAGNLTIWHKEFAKQTAINVDDTRNMVEVALNKLSKRFIFTSSMASYGLQPGPVSENTPSLAYELGENYSISKLEAERIVKTATKQGLFACSMLPAGIMGPKDRHSWAGMMMSLRDGKIKGIPSGRLPMAHVNEVMKAHITAVEHGRSGENYILAGESVTFEKLFRLMADNLRIELKAKPAPLFMLKIVGHAQVLASTITGKPPTLTPLLAQMLSSQIDADTDKARRELDFHQVPVATCVADCVNWQRKENLL